MIGVHWRLTDGRWTVDKREVRVDPSPIPPVPFAKSTSSEGKNHTKKDIDEFGATVGSPGCTAIKDNKRAQAHSDRCRVRIEELPQSHSARSRRLDQRLDVIHGALSKEVKRSDPKKK